MHIIIGEGEPAQQQVITLLEDFCGVCRPDITYGPLNGPLHFRSGDLFYCHVYPVMIAGEPCKTISDITIFPDGSARIIRLHRPAGREIHVCPCGAASPCLELLLVTPVYVRLA